MLEDLPKGFEAGAVAANFKKAGRDDLGLIYSQKPCVFAGMFTTNLFKAAPVRMCEDILRQGNEVRAVVANSGQANACTGEEGLENCREIQQEVARMLGIAPGEVLLISTGVIGAQLDMSKWRRALPGLIESKGEKDAEGFTRAFMTTDAFPKFSSRTLDFSARQVRLTVMAKGAGMICPNMATMLCVVLTDAKVEQDEWRAMFQRCVARTFNRVSVDGDTSTNDTILGLANGASGVSLTADNAEKFEQELQDILGKVAYMLVKDGEGCKKVLHITVRGAGSEEDARLAARAIGASQLVKTAIYGGDANWGRIVNAAGYSGARFKPEETSLVLCGIERFSKGKPVNDDMEQELAQLLQNNDVTIEVCLGTGPGEYSMLASDLGHEYVTLNSDYRS